MNQTKSLILSMSLALLFLYIPTLKAEEKALATPTTVKIPESEDVPGWTYQKYLLAFKLSGRNTSLTAQEFAKLRERKQVMLWNIRHFLTSKFGQADPKILKAFQDMPREYFQYDYQKQSDFSKTAYEDPARSWALGWGSALSDYDGQAYMAQLAHPRPKDRVLEIGTGSGFNVALFSRLVKKAYSIEIIQPLGEAVSQIFKPLGYTNIRTRVGDGYYGWKSAGKFDIIIFTCTAKYVPPALFKQLKPGGRIIIPIGQPFKHHQILYTYHLDPQGKVHSKKNIPVYFIPMEGKMYEPKDTKLQKTAPSQPAPSPLPQAGPSSNQTPIPTRTPKPAPFYPQPA